MKKPLAIDLFCVSEGYDVIGFDIERHVYGEMAYPAQLVIQDVCTLRGSQFKDANLIVASPPCQEYSYMAMPWKLAKAKAKAIREDTTGVKLAMLNKLFNECFRIQKEACFSAGRHIPLVVENVRGAQEWVGRARWNYGSFYLWGDVPALMPPTLKATKVPGFRFDGSGRSFQTASADALGREDGQKTPLGNCSSGMWKDRPISRYGHPTLQEMDIHGFKDHHSDAGTKNGSKGRKMASAMIAKIPMPLSRHIGATYKELKLS